MKLRARKNGKQHRWSLTVTWIVLMMVLSMVVTVAADTDLTATVAVDGLTVSSTGTDWTGSATAASWTGNTSGSSCNGYTPQTGKLVLTNNSTEDKVLSFAYTLTLNSGSVKIDGASVTANSTFKKSLAAGASVTIETSSRSGATGTTTVKLTNIKLEVPTVTVTFSPASNGGYTLDGTSVTASTSLTKPATQKYTLVATPAEHYVFQGWYLNDTTLCYTGEKWENTTFPEGGTVTAKFTEDPLYKIATATDAEKDDLVEINSRYYHDPRNDRNATQTTTLTRCYYSVAATTGTKDDYDVQYVPFLDWAVSGSGIKVAKSGTAQGEYYQGGGILGANSWIYSSMVANVIQIKAKADCIITFDYTNTAGMTTDDSEADLPYLWLYQSTENNATISKIQSSGTKNNSTGENIQVALSKDKYLYICMSGRGVNKTWVSAGGGYGSADFNYSGTISNFNVAPNTQEGTHTSVFQDNMGNVLTGGKLKVNDTTYTTTDGGITPITLPTGTAMKVSVATVPANYRLLGWSVDGTMHYASTYEYELGEDTTAVNPIFVPNVVTYNPTAGTYQYKNTGGTFVALDGQYIARNTAATSYYASLEKAFEENNEVVLLGNMTIEGNYEIPSGKTLMVPRAMTGAPTWDSTKSWYTPTIVSAGRSVYATLTMKGDLTVNGKLVVDGGQSGSNGSVYGPYGVVEIQGTVTVNSGAEVYAYGVIKGTGTIDAQSGAKIHELMEILDMRHPITLMNITNEASSMRLFPFNSIYIYSIEAPVVYHSGATLYGHHCSSYTAQGAFTIISDTNAMFLVSGGTVTKSFKDGRMLIRIDEGATVHTGSMEETMTGSFSGMDQDITVDSADYLLPLTSGYHIQVAGDFFMDHGFKMLPGAILDVQSTGTMTISSGANLVLYRLNDYDYRKSYKVDDVEVAAGFSTAGYPINFSRYSSGFKIDTVGSAQLNVDGTLIVKGGLHVTNQLMPVTEDNKYTAYENGYNFLTGFGTIDVSAATSSDGKIYENLTYSQTTDLQTQTVNIIPIKGLNPEATADVPDQYSQLTGVMYGRTNTNNLNVWTSDPCQFGHTFIFDGAVITYTWAENKSSVTAEVTCKYCDEKLTETVDTSFETVTAADCKTEGTGTYTAIFENAAFTEQTENVVIPVTPHTPGDPADCENDQICTECGEVLEAAKGHGVAEWTVTVKPTCMEAGLESGVCSVCGETQTKTVDPLGGYHQWKDGECIKDCCDEVFLFVGTSVAVEEGLDMYFYVDAADVADTDTAFYAVVTKVFADGRDDVVETIPMTESDTDNAAGWQTVKDTDTDEVLQYRFAFTDISAKEMMDGITAVVCYKDGENVVQASQTYTESVRTYAENAYKMYGEAQPELATALADMLNYGAACQKVFGYDPENLANAGMSDEWKAKATTADPSLEGHQRVKSTYFDASTFSAKNALMYTFYFDFVDENGTAVTIPETAYAVVTYYDPSGTAENPKPVEIKVPYAKWFHETATSHGVDVTIPIAWGRTKIECVIHDGNGNVISTGNSDSIVAYTNRIQETTESKKAQRAAMLDLLRFVDSANTYFNTKKV